MNVPREGFRGDGLRAWIAFAVLVAAWGSSYLFIRYSIESFTPLGISASRFTVAGLVCLGLARWRGEVFPPVRSWWRLALLGVMMMSGANALTAFAQQTVPSGIAAVLHALSSVWLVLLGALPGLGRERLRASIVGSALLGVVGIAVLLWPTGDAHVDPRGAAALVLATWLFTVASLLQRKWKVPGGLFATLGVEMLAAAAVSGGLALWAGGLEHGFLHGPLTTHAALGFVWLVVVSSIAGFGAYGVVLSAWPPARVGTFAVINPIVAVLLGVLVAGEGLSPRMLLGASITLAAVVWVQFRG